MPRCRNVRGSPGPRLCGRSWAPKDTGPWRGGLDRAHTLVVSSHRAQPGDWPEPRALPVPRTQPGDSTRPSRSQGRCAAPRHRSRLMARQLRATHRPKGPHLETTSAYLLPFRRQLLRSSDGVHAPCTLSAGLFFTMSTPRLDERRRSDRCHPAQWERTRKALHLPHLRARRHEDGDTCRLPDDR